MQLNFTIIYKFNRNEIQLIFHQTLRWFFGPSWSCVRRHDTTSPSNLIVAGHHLMHHPSQWNEQVVIRAHISHHETYVLYVISIVDKNNTHKKSFQIHSNVWLAWYRHGHQGTQKLSHILVNHLSELQKSLQR